MWCKLVSVIVSTYNSIEWLSKVLEGYKIKKSIYERIIADDGKGRHQRN